MPRLTFFTSTLAGRVTYYGATMYIKPINYFLLISSALTSSAKNSLPKKYLFAALS